MEWVLAILTTGGVGVALLVMIKEYGLFFLKSGQDKKTLREQKEMQMDVRVTKLESKHDSDVEILRGSLNTMTDMLTDMSEMIRQLTGNSMAVSRDRIRYLCNKYLDDGEITSEQWSDLKILANEYSKLPNANGNIDILMSEVDRLPRCRKDRRS